MKLRCLLREIRGRRPLSALAAETGINAGELSKLETGRSLPRDEWLPALEAAYGVPKSEWWDRETLLVIEFPEDEPE